VPVSHQMASGEPGLEQPVNAMINEQAPMTNRLRMTNAQAAMTNK